MHFPIGIVRKVLLLFVSGSGNFTWGLNVLSTGFWKFRLEKFFRKYNPDGLCYPYFILICRNE